MNHGQTPLEAEWMIEVSDSVIGQGIDRKTANDILLKIAKTFEGEKPQTGFDITECYDLIHHNPKPEYQRTYTDVRERLKNIGVNLS
jgi:hypothetical protein